MIYYYKTICAHLCDQILPAPNVCYIQLDYEELKVSSVNGKCAYDSISILRSPEGPAGRLCGDKTGYASLTRVQAGQEIGLSAIMQSGGYKWKIKITMIDCDSVPADVPRISDCGIAGNLGGTSRPRRLGGSPGGRKLPRNVVKKKIKTKIRKQRSVSQSALCAMTGLEDFCDTRSFRFTFL